MNSIVKQNLDWLFHFNKDKNDFINLINARGGNWAESLSELIQNLKRKRKRKSKSYTFSNSVCEIYFYIIFKGSLEF